jgi:hypothetical protein
LCSILQVVSESRLLFLIFTDLEFLPWLKDFRPSHMFMIELIFLLGAKRCNLILCLTVMTFGKKLRIHMNFLLRLILLF